MLLAVVLSVLAVVGYSLATGRCSPPPPQPKEKKDAPEPPPSNGGGVPPVPAPGPGPAPVPVPSPEPPPVDEGPQAAVPEQERVILKNERIEVALTSAGGAIESVRLLEDYDPGGTNPMDLVVPVDSTLLLGQIDDTIVEPAEAPGGAGRRDEPPGPLRKLHWTLAKPEAGAAGGQEATYTFETAGGLVYTKRWFLPAGAERFDVHVEVSVRAKDGAKKDPVVVKVLASSGLVREAGTGATFSTPNTAFYRLSDSNDVSTGHLWGIALERLLLGRRLETLGARSQFFMASYYAPDAQKAPKVLYFWATGEDASKRVKAIPDNLLAFFRSRRGMDLNSKGHESLAKRMVEGAETLHHAWFAAELPVGAAPVEMAFYVGPIARHTLAQDEYAGLESVITYDSAFDVVADFLLWIYDRYFFLFGSVGLGIMLMTLTVRGLLMPISIRNQLSMRRYGRKVSKVKPKLEALQKKFANNPKRMREEQMKLYKEHGIGFPTGCLMMLIQLPIFFALFSCLRTEYTLRNASFLWITDLSGPDRLIDLGTTINLFVVQVSSINVLPLLLVGLSIWQQRRMPKPTDEQQAQQMKMMKWLPIIFAVILYNYTAALALYMVISSSIALIESAIVRRKDPEGGGGVVSPM
jgi:YidC/Oxa1 family membrane protein insertase